MGQVTFSTASLGDVLRVADNLRPSDRSELMAARGDDVDVVDVLRTAWERSSQCYVALDDEAEPVMVFGVVPLMDGMGSPWLLGTEGMTLARDALLHEMQPFVERFHEEYPVLLNRVDARQRKTIKWLKYLGFEVGDEVPHGPYDMPFRFFRRERDV